MTGDPTPPDHYLDFGGAANGRDDKHAMRLRDGDNGTDYGFLIADGALVARWRDGFEEMSWSWNTMSFRVRFAHALTSGDDAPLQRPLTQGFHTAGAYPSRTTIAALTEWVRTH